MQHFFSTHLIWHYIVVNRISEIAGLMRSFDSPPQPSSCTPKFAEIHRLFGKLHLPSATNTAPKHGPRVLFRFMRFRVSTSLAHTTEHECDVRNACERLGEKLGPGCASPPLGSPITNFFLLPYNRFLWLGRLLGSGHDIMRVEVEEPKSTTVVQDLHGIPTTGTYPEKQKMLPSIHSPTRS
jgi:hypothetical protein